MYHKTKRQRLQTRTRTTSNHVFSQKQPKNLHLTPIFITYTTSHHSRAATIAVPKSMAITIFHRLSWYVMSGNEDHNAFYERIMEEENIRNPLLIQDNS